MFKVATKISRPSEVVWTYFTRPETWTRWYGGGLTKIEPAWQKGAKLFWELGGSSLVADFVPGRQVVLTGSWMDTKYEFISEGTAMTVVEMTESDPKGGASFSDGGAAHRIRCEKTLQRLKSCIESEIVGLELEPALEAAPHAAIEPDGSALAPAPSSSFEQRTRDGDAATIRTAPVSCDDRQRKTSGTKVIAGAILTLFGVAGFGSILSGKHPSPLAGGIAYFVFLVGGLLLLVFRFKRRAAKKAPSQITSF